MNQLVDTHCHIQSAGLTNRGEKITHDLWQKSPTVTRETIISRAVDSGVTRMLCVGCDLDDSKLAVEFVQDQPNCWATIGIHPHEAQHYVGQRQKLAEFAELAKRPKVVAIGECGLDYYYSHSPKAAQIEILKLQMGLAAVHNLPLIFHVRDALDDFWPIFDSYQGLRGVLHSFTDTTDNLKKALDRGLYIGVNGIATFAKNPAQLTVYKAIPEDRLLLETDAPFLTPTPYRGSINEPNRITNIADFVADLRDISLEHLSAVTTSNARRLFDI